MDDCLLGVRPRKVLIIKELNKRSEKTKQSSERREAAA